MQIETNRESRLAIAKRMGLMLVDPSTRVDETILRIGSELYKLPEQKR